MHWRGHLYSLVTALVFILIVMGLSHLALMSLGPVEPSRTWTAFAFLVGGMVGLGFLFCFPVAGLIYRYDREAFRQMAAPVYAVPSRPAPPPLQMSALWQAARWLIGLGLLTDGVTLSLSVLGWETWTPPGVLFLVGVYLALTLLVGSGLYLRLRGPLH